MNNPSAFFRAVTAWTCDILWAWTVLFIEVKAPVTLNFLALGFYQLDIVDLCYISVFCAPQSLLL